MCGAAAFDSGEAEFARGVEGVVSSGRARSWSSALSRLMTMMAHSSFVRAVQ
jgi:hypothetical protein